MPAHNRIASFDTSQNCRIESDAGDGVRLRSAEDVALGASVSRRLHAPTREPAVGLGGYFRGTKTSEAHFQD
jgi:hypothetical protein